MYVVVAYDVTDDRRRARLADRLLDFLPRVQKSVFEGEVPEVRLGALHDAILEIVDLEEDAVRIYFLCRRCIGRIEGMGRGPVPGTPDPDVVV